MFGHLQRVIFIEFFYFKSITYYDPTIIKEILTQKVEGTQSQHTTQ